MNLQEQLLEATKLSVDGDSFSFYAATIHYCVKNRLAKLTDKELPTLTTAEYQLIKAQVKDGTYGSAMRLYTVRATNERYFHMVLAHSETDAIHCIQQTTGDIAIKAHDVTDRGRWRIMDTWGGGTIMPSLLDITGNPPAYLGFYFKEEGAIQIPKEFAKRVRNKELLGVYKLTNGAKI